MPICIANTLTGQKCSRETPSNQRLCWQHNSRNQKQFGGADPIDIIVDDGLGPLKYARFIQDIPLTTNIGIQWYYDGIAVINNSKSKSTLQSVGMKPIGDLALTNHSQLLDKSRAKPIPNLNVNKCYDIITKKLTNRSSLNDPCLSTEAFDSNTIPIPKPIPLPPSTPSRFNSSSIGQNFNPPLVSHNNNCKEQFDWLAFTEFMQYLWSHPQKSLFNRGGNDINRYGKRYEYIIFSHLLQFGNMGAESSVKRIDPIKKYFFSGNDLKEPKYDVPVTLIRIYPKYGQCELCGIKSRKLSVYFEELDLLLGCDCAVKLYLLSRLISLIAQARSDYLTSILTKEKGLQYWIQICEYENKVKDNIDFINKKYSNGFWNKIGCNSFD
jgi:hypothetical protein